MLNEIVMLTSEQPVPGGKPYVITKVYKNGSLKVSPVVPSKDIRGNLDDFTYDELIAAATLKRKQAQNEAKYVIGTTDQFTSEAELNILIDNVLADYKD